MVSTGDNKTSLISQNEGMHMTKRKRLNPTTEKILWAMSSGRCEKCGRLIYQHPLSKVIGNFAQIAHNLPVANNGPRSDFKVIDSNADINDVSNLLLLCYDCHREIDEIAPDKYPPEELKRIKFDFDEFILKATNVERIEPTLVIKYSPNLHNKRLQVTGVQKALFPEKYIKEEVDLTLCNSAYTVGDTEFWSIEIGNLVRTFNQKVLPAIENYKDGFINISVFAIGPIPLLVKLGTLLSNKHNIDVYQLKKSPQSTWEWEYTNEETEYLISYLRETENPEKVIILFSISGIIRAEEVQQSISFDNSIVVEIRTNHAPSDDFLRNKTQLDKFVKCYQAIKEEIRNKCSKNVMVHMFLSVPVAAAVEIGRHWNMTVDLPFTVYNYTNGVYEKAITIGEINEAIS